MFATLYGNGPKNDPGTTESQESVASTKPSTPTSTPTSKQTPKSAPAVEAQPVSSLGRLRALRERLPFSRKTGIAVASAGALLLMGTMIFTSFQDRYDYKVEVEPVEKDYCPRAKVNICVPSLRKFHRSHGNLPH